MSVDSLVSWTKHVSGSDLDGVTISGGEPFDQAEGLSELMSQIEQWRDREKPNLDVLCYTGYPERLLRDRYAELLARFDVVIAEPYVHSRDTLPLRGSDNQKVILNSALAKKRYSNLSNWNHKHLQVQMDEKHLWIVGIPKPGDLGEIERQCRDRGLVLHGTSWRA